jgi:hypothetical protein
MSNYKRCAELCDDRGFARQAALLREVGAGRGRAYLVDTPHWVKVGLGWDVAGEPGRETTRTVFLDLEDAERFARELSARALRGSVVQSGVVFTHYFRFLTMLPRDDFCSRVGEILGRPYRLPAGRKPLIPETATDEQLLRIVPLLNLEFCTVVAVDIAP